jgi:hypothetical protein
MALSAASARSAVKTFLSWAAVPLPQRGAGLQDCYRLGTRMVNTVSIPGRLFTVIVP